MRDLWKRGCEIPRADRGREAPDVRRVRERGRDTGEAEGADEAGNAAATGISFRRISTAINQGATIKKTCSSVSNLILDPKFTAHNPQKSAAPNPLLPLPGHEYQSQNRAVSD